MDANHADNVVRDWYTKMAGSEWKRLWRDPYHQIEFMVTMHFLEKYLPKKGLILDSGGGPGRYTITLASKGYDVVLLDLTPKMLKIAKRKIRQAGVQGKVKEIVEGSIVDLSMFADKAFDGVLCLGGPLSHILKRGARVKAVRELVRVAKIGAPIFASVIGRIGVLKGIPLFYPQEMQYGLVHWETGDYIPGVNGSVTPNDEVIVYANVTDLESGVGSVLLNYTNGNGTWTTTSMVNLEGTVWNGTIPKFDLLPRVNYTITAQDLVGNVAATEQELGYSYGYQVIPELSLTLVAAFLIVTSLAAATIIRAKKRNHKLTKNPQHSQSQLLRLS